MCPRRLLRHELTTLLLLTLVLILLLVNTMRGRWLPVAAGIAASVVVTAGLVMFAIYRIRRPLQELTRGAERFACGELKTPLPVHDSETIGGLARAMNQMAAQLDARIRTILQQRNELEAVLSSMVEGVLAVDVEERVISLNQAGARLLNVNPAQIQGRSIQQVLRNADLLRFVARALAAGDPVEGDIVLRDGGERYLNAHGTVLRDTEGRSIGALIVLNDVTRLRKLETVRRDFVANVSHEIRTPITSIKGFVETLLDGAKDDPEMAERFLRIVARQAERLNAIVDDLLALSRIEEESEQTVASSEPCRLTPVLQAALQVCQSSAEKRNVTLELTGDPELALRINTHLVEQAVINLVDNAIKHSEAGQKVRVHAERNGVMAHVHVIDEGCGIEAEHLPRLFERFYRVDKGRSRQMGGTGLGLSIVKHIAAAHKGRVAVESTPGKGSTFTISLPL